MFVVLFSMIYSIYRTIPSTGIVAIRTRYFVFDDMFYLQNDSFYRNRRNTRYFVFDDTLYLQNDSFYKNRRNT